MGYEAAHQLEHVLRNRTHHLFERDVQHHLCALFVHYHISKNTLNAYESIEWLNKDGAGGELLCYI